MTTARDPGAMRANFTVPTNGARTGKCSAWGEKKPWDVQIGVLFKEARDKAPRARYVAIQTENKTKRRNHEADLVSLQLDLDLSRKPISNTRKLSAGLAPQRYAGISVT